MSGSPVPLALEVDPAWEGRAGEVLAALEAGRLPAGAVAVKESTVRTVHRVALAGGVEAFVKRDRPRSLFERVKGLVLGSRSRAEWRNLGRLGRQGFPVPERIALGERRRAGPLGLGLGLEESVLVTRSVGPAERLYSWLAAAGPAARQAVLREAAALARRLHDAGYFHRDYHCGNILVASAGGVAGADRVAGAGAGGGAGRLFLVDLARVLKLPFVPRAARARDLAILLHDLADLLGPEERRVALEAYGGPPGFAARVRAAEAARRRERLASRGKRCVVPSTAFRIERCGPLRIFRRAEVAAGEVLAAIERHRATIAAGPGAPGFLKRDHATSVSRQGALAVKEFPERGALASLQHLVRRHRGRAAWMAAHALILRGIATPEPLALVEVRGAGLVRGSVIVTRFVEDAQDLHRFVNLSWSGLAPREARAVLAALARFVAKLHSEGLYHNDLKPTNVLVRGGGGGGGAEFLLLDLDGLSLRKRLTERRRAKNLAQIEDYARLYFARVSRRARLRFFAEYLRAARIGRQAARRLLMRIEREVRARAERRARRAALSGRAALGSEASA